MRKKYLVRKNKMYWTGHDWADSPACARTFDLEVTAVMWAVSLDATVAEHRSSPKRHTKKGKSQTSINIVQWIEKHPDGVSLDDVITRFGLRDRNNALIRLNSLANEGEISRQGSQRRTRYFPASLHKDTSII